ncbi:hypothetical protein [Aureimonas altamirensis]|uniref:hypothetical protein n=1 Tax=Aureimonas altamirensis TaxID=370622 RepID=UPI003B97A109
MPMINGLAIVVGPGARAYSCCSHMPKQALPRWPRHQQSRRIALIFYDAKQPGPNPVVVRLFVHERQGLRFDVETIDLAGLEHRKPAYRNTVNARGEVPALRLDDGRIITEITAISTRSRKAEGACSARRRKSARRSICGRGGPISKSSFRS